MLYAGREAADSTCLTMTCLALMIDPIKIKTCIALILGMLVIPLIAVAQPSKHVEVETPHKVQEVAEESPQITENKPEPVEVVNHAQSNTVGVAYTPDMNRYNHLFVQAAQQYGVSYQLLKAISLCENVRQDPTLQSGLYYNFNHPRIGIVKGEREASYGLAQINLHYNPHVTYEQATNPEFSINFLASNVAAGRASMWACYTGGGYIKYT